MDKELKNVALFVGGVLFFTIAMPCLDSISCLFQSAVNKKVAHMQMDLEESQCEHESACELIKPNNSNMTQAVGFQIPSDEDYEEC